MLINFWNHSFVAPVFSLMILLTVGEEMTLLDAETNITFYRKLNEKFGQVKVN